MVSIIRSVNRNSGGATFFSDSDMMDSRELQPILEHYGTFKPLKTVPAFTVHLLYTLGLEIMAIIYAIIHPDEKHRCMEYFVIIYAHIGLWFLTLLLDQIARMKHFELRINGYLDFYNKIRIQHRLPFYVVSLWNAVIMLIQTIMQHFYPDHFEQECLKGGVLSPISYLCAFITVEFLVIAGVNIDYIVKVRRFNMQKMPPDVQKEEWASASNTDGLNQAEIGYRQLGDKFYDFVEKQADLIRHLRDHNEKLAEKIVLLNAQLKNQNAAQSTAQ
ncbi:transmembrane protein 192 isoform X1 [Coccinella septempunctata]|uniref:transmembrane protein 192 isoform X1 n=2 Tax=Coccinella septempunctata TaxID=41139 RepID=UPI001D07BBC3|nr:transmembrane protein 192 isoform X1 [Coccinella septempunctata]